MNKASLITFCLEFMWDWMVYCSWWALGVTIFNGAERF